METDVQIGERFARAIADKDSAGLTALLAPDVEFRAVTPRKFWESDSATEVVDGFILGLWFGPSDDIEALESVEHETVVDRERVGYRFRVKNDGGTHLVEQQAYYEVEDGKISWLRIMCAGYQRIAD